jgi:ABC-type Zn uptake system ZnuABC Zn-binding protein ZnuA
MGGKGEEGANGPAEQRRGFGQRASMLLLASALVVSALSGAILGGCGSAPASGATGRPQVLADTSFLADIVQNVAGSRLQVTSLIPLGVDPHSFEPTPRDAANVARCDLLILNTRGLEPQVDSLVENGGRAERVVIEAAAGLQSRDTGSGEMDPHFWLDPTKVITYVANIRAGLVKVDPAGAAEYTENAEAYTAKLIQLDSWIVERVATIPVLRRLLVTNHESFGYFADRYGFHVVGTVFQTMGAEGTPSARQLADLVQKIRTTGAPAIFLETGSTPDLASQIARETRVEVVSDLYTHSLGKGAATYLDMMRWNVDKIVQALE